MVAPKMELFDIFFMTVMVVLIKSFGGAAGAEKAIPAEYPADKVALMPESLAMPRTSMAFISDRMIRLFNGRGATCIRDKSVTGLQTFFFPPIEVRDYDFKLAFEEQESNILIQDVVADVYEYYAKTGKGPHPLGLNFQDPNAPFVILLQHAYWQPNLFSRTGTFHKKFNGRWISFGIETRTSVSAETDEIYVSVQIENREPKPLQFTVLAQQSASELTLKYPCEKAKPSGPVTHPDAFSIASEQIKITVQSDLVGHNTDGWYWEIPGNEKQTARFALVLKQTEASSTSLYAPDLHQRVQRADKAVRGRLDWASERLPHILTSDKQFNDFYYRCILSVLETRWQRENFVVNPFWAIGNWGYTIAWDTSFASELLAILDPEGLRKAILLYIRAGLLKSSNIPWNGKSDRYWYIQTPFAVMQIVQDYLRQTGDLATLDRMEEDTSVVEQMKQAGLELMKRFRQSDGLLDFGAGSNQNQRIEIRTDGYQHMVPAFNGLAANYLRQIAQWCRDRNDPDASKLEQWADQLEISMREKLWNEQEGWFDNLHADGRRELVWSYHLFDLLDKDVLSPSQLQGLISHLTEGEFLGPFGMYSISKRDHIHWDLEDVDWGGGGQYVGMSLRIAESLFRLGYSEPGWDILNRCKQWSMSYPYLPQEIFTDFLRSPEVVEMSLEISAGSGVQAILFGVFGLRPQVDGSLEILPSYHQKLGDAKMTGYRFRGHSYDVVMGPLEFKVYRNGELMHVNPYGQPVRFPRP